MTTSSESRYPSKPVAGWSYQEILEHVWAHLREQGRRSLAAGGTGCVYRGVGDAACALGCLMSDELAERADEVSVGSLKTFVARDCTVTDTLYWEVSREVLDWLGVARRVASRGDFVSPDEGAPRRELLLRELQKIHDYREPEEWEYQLGEAARRYGLEPLVPLPADAGGRA